MASDPLADDRITAYGRLVEAHRRLSRIFDRRLRAETGLSDTWFEALLRLGRSPDRQLAITELGDQMVLTSGGATRLVDRLVDAGYVTREACPTDRRVQWARLTDAGLAKVTAAIEIHLADLDEHFTSQLTTAELDQLGAVLDRLRDPSPAG